MLETLVTSKTRLKLLYRFFLNPESRGYLRELAEEFGESTNAVRLELNRFAEAGLLISWNEGRTRVYRADPAHPLFPEIQALVRKTLGIDRIIDRVLARLGNLRAAYITGDYARGIDGGVIDLVLVGNIDWQNLQGYIAKAERTIGRRIRTSVVPSGASDALRDRSDLHRALCLVGGAEAVERNGGGKEGPDG